MNYMLQVAKQTLGVKFLLKHKNNRWQYTYWFDNGTKWRKYEGNHIMVLTPDRGSGKFDDRLYTYMYLTASEYFAELL